MKISAAWTVFRKELLEVLRDRRSLIFMLFVPTISIPALLWLTTDLIAHFASRLALQPMNVLILNPEVAPSLVKQIQQRSTRTDRAQRLADLLLEKGITEKELSLVGDNEAAFHGLLARAGVKPEALVRQLSPVVNERDFEFSPKNILLSAFPPNLRLVTKAEAGIGEKDLAEREEDALLEAVRNNQIAAAIRFEENAAEVLNKKNSAGVTLFYLESSDRSLVAKDGLHQILEKINASMLQERLNEANLSDGFERPLHLLTRRLPGPGLVVKLMSQLLPYLIILFSFLGALFPAIDLGAGEKERGTLETLLVTPVGRFSIIVGKFAVVLLAAVVAALLAAFSLTFSIQLGLLSDLSLVSGGTFSFRWVEAMTAILLVFPVGCVFSSVLLALSLFAKSFKEAQTYAGPLQTVIILPAFVSFLPGIELDWWMSSIPVVNVSMALREIFTGNLDRHIGHVIMIFITTTLVAGLLLWFTSWWSQRESVLFRN
jgi:sodium transport system permease protein